jgi:hypothetical protein
MVLKANELANQIIETLHAVRNCQEQDVMRAKYRSLVSKAEGTFPTMDALARTGVFKFHEAMLAMSVDLSKTVHFLVPDLLAAARRYAIAVAHIRPMEWGEAKRMTALKTEALAYFDKWALTNDVEGAVKEWREEAEQKVGLKRLLLLESLWARMTDELTYDEPAFATLAKEAGLSTEAVMDDKVAWWHAAMREAFDGTLEAHVWRPDVMLAAQAVADVMVLDKKLERYANVTIELDLRAEEKQLVKEAVLTAALVSVKLEGAQKRALPEV